jgi:hypothetical protein
MGTRILIRGTKIVLSSAISFLKNLLYYHVKVNGSSGTCDVPAASPTPHTTNSTGASTVTSNSLGFMLNKLLKLSLVNVMLLNAILL